MDIYIYIEIYPEYVRICQNISKYVRICQNMSEYIRICQNMSEYCKIYGNLCKSIKISQNLPDPKDAQHDFMQNGGIVARHHLSWRARFIWTSKMTVKWVCVMGVRYWCALWVCVMGSGA